MGMLLKRAENHVFNETLAVQSGRRYRGQMGRVVGEMSRKAEPSGSRTVGVEGNEENICHIWRAFWFSSRRSANSWNRAASRGEEKRINTSRWGKDGFLIYKIVALYIFVSSLA